MKKPIQVTHIEPEEIENYFEVTYSDKIMDLYYEIKENAKMASLGMLENEKPNTTFDFVELIKNNIDLVPLYKKKYKL